MEEWSITKLQEMMHSSTMSATEIVQFFLDRIEKIDQQGPRRPDRWP